ncbi:glucosamine-6-phosphate deaminase [Bacillus sp. DTU_2020_1000418_1_SI_GHA_SEK_038]|uniref:glucosamine-6-phosphate deaminase n=1 Tax=Bacillus sp. DTU_2020_1000418_1_SI_GHA_SEK_038 TaxID=3077585 RepID=UPI0028F0877A|nr:glucosamine-6-phosphate deaminase [Bacillus sp. DTU_2020_1000418_1_SI_GHA_SEK_038]WNS75047.1 glucosamine-6-phosphate deaminase [Bacillus sp. DTU_2020_1000418_1_SI_GHA_SEK_038]
MKIIRTANYEEMSKKAAEIMIDRIRNNPEITLGLATGSTPKGVYQKLIEDHVQHMTSYKKITTVNLDEYVGIDEHDPNSYHYFMKEQLLDHIDIPASQTHLPNGMAENLHEECSKYEALIDSFGGIGLQLLGIGENGHIGFNEPGTPFSSKTHMIKLEEDTRRANARFFNSLEEVPTHAVTMGIATIMASKEIILLASGKSKANAIHQLINGEIHESIPASALKNHPNFTIIADDEALKLI